MFWALCGTAGEGWRRDAEVSVHTCPLQSEAGVMAGPPQTWAPAAGEGELRSAGPHCLDPRLTAPSLTSQALRDAPWTQRAGGPREQREALLTPGPSMGLRVVWGLGLLQRSMCRVSASQPASGHSHPLPSPSGFLTTGCSGHTGSQGGDKGSASHTCPEHAQEPVKGLMTARVSGMALAGGDGSRNTIRVLLLR